MRRQPALRTVPAYHDDPAYITALAQSIKAHLATLDWEPEKVIASYHGIPMSYFRQGDPYHCHCLKTSRLLRDELGWDNDYLISTFQSRFGPDPWLQPYLDEYVTALAEKHAVVQVAMPAFTADCLETLEEIGMELRDDFLEAGGRELVPRLSKLPVGSIPN